VRSSSYDIYTTFNIEQFLNKVLGNKSDRFRQLVDRYAQQIDAWMLAWSRARNK